MRNICIFATLAAVLALIAMLFIPAPPAQAQSNGGGSGAPMPKINLLERDQKSPLTPEEQERQNKLDDDYKAATNKIPNQKANDPWADVRPTPTAPAPKKKQQ
jgi:hypothetical protein